MQTTDLVLQIVIAACTLLGVLGGIYKLFNRILSRLDRIENKVNKIERWQNTHMTQEHRTWRR